MIREIKNVLVVVNLAKEDAEKIGIEVEKYLVSNGFHTEVLRFVGKPPSKTASRFDMAFSLGGDGTVLYCARLLADYGIPILAINIGYFGFITDVAKDEWRTAFEMFLDGRLGISERIMLGTRVYRGEQEVASYYGLNDTVIASGGISKVVRLSLRVGNTNLGNYRADGVIVSTPTGSTAYSAAAGGPILDPEMNAIILNPICPFTLSNRPLVLRGMDPVFIGVEEGQRTGVIMTVDGQDVISLEEGDQVCFQVSEVRARIIRSNRRNFFEVLRSKLNWSGGPNA